MFNHRIFFFLGPAARPVKSVGLRALIDFNSKAGSAAGRAVTLLYLCQHNFPATGVRAMGVGQKFKGRTTFIAGTVVSHLLLELLKMPRQAKAHTQFQVRSKGSSLRPRVQRRLQFVLQLKSRAFDPYRQMFDA
jgi:hypothetical protein